MGVTRGKNPLAMDNFRPAAADVGLRAAKRAMVAFSRGHAMKRNRKPMKTREINWKRIEAEFRAGGISVSALARKHAVSEPAVRQHAKEGGWVAAFPPPPPERVSAQRKAVLLARAEADRLNAVARAAQRAARAAALAPVAPPQHLKAPDVAPAVPTSTPAQTSPVAGWPLRWPDPPPAMPDKPAPPKAPKRVSPLGVPLSEAGAAAAEGRAMPGPPEEEEASPPPSPKGKGAAAAPLPAVPLPTGPDGDPLEPADLGKELVHRMMEELHFTTAGEGVIEDLIWDETRADRSARRRTAMLQAVSLPTRAATIKTLAQALSTLRDAAGAGKAVAGVKASRTEAAKAAVAGGGRFAVPAGPRLVASRD